MQERPPTDSLCLERRGEGSLALRGRALGRWGTGALGLVWVLESSRMSL